MLRRSLPLIFLVATFARGAVLRVPFNYPTIQSAIDAAANGDEIIVAAGTYNERLDTAGKKIVIRSSDGPERTILDGSSLGQAILTATHGESLATTIRGFTFQNGEGTLTTACGFQNARLGGAILVVSGAISIVDCIFTHNGVTKIVAGGAICACRSSVAIADSRFDGNDSAYGGAIYYNTPVSRTATIERSTFRANGPNGAAIEGVIRTASVTVSGSSFAENKAAYGPGIVLEAFGGATVSVLQSTFTRNIASFGGGVNLYMADSSSLSISTCTFDGNEASFGGGANVVVNDNASADVVESTFLNNHASFGGGLFATTHGSSAHMRVERSRFTDNEAVSRPDTGIYSDTCYTDGPPPRGNGFFFGGGADLRTIGGGDITVTGCLLAGNKAVRAGGAHASSCAGGTVRFVNCTIADNGTSGLHLRQGFPNAVGDTGSEQMDVANSIVYGNGGNQLISESGSLGGSAMVDHSDVQSGFPGFGNFDLAPNFAAPQMRDYHLASGSPCIDAGNNGAIEPAVKVDLAGGPRFLDDPSTPDKGIGAAPVVDIGAFEFQPPPRRRVVGRR